MPFVRRLKTQTPTNLLENPYNCLLVVRPVRIVVEESAFIRAALVVAVDFDLLYSDQVLRVFIDVNMTFEDFEDELRAVLIQIDRLQLVLSRGALDPFEGNVPELVSLYCYRTFPNPSPFLFFECSYSEQRSSILVAEFDEIE